MAKADLTAERLRELLDYDRETGVFTWRVVRGKNKTRPGVVAGCTKEGGYRIIRIDDRLHRAHRLAWLHVHGKHPEGDIDHIDGNPSNNAFANLRDVDKSTNMQNRRRHQANNKTGLLGVSFDRNKGNFIASISVNRKTVHIGRFDSAEAASSAYLAERRKRYAGNTL